MDLPRFRPALPGPLPLLAAAFALGLAGPARWETAALVAIFPLAFLGLVGSWLGARRFALLAMAIVFLLAGVVRGADAELPAGESDPTADARESGPALPVMATGLDELALAGGRGVAEGSKEGPSAAAGSTGGDPAARPGTAGGPCLSGLRSAGLPGPTEKERPRLEVEGRVEGAPAVGFETTRAVVSLVRARPARDRPTDEPGPWRDAGGLKVEVSMEAQARPLPGDRLRAIVRLDDVEVGLPGGEEARRRLDRAGISCVGRVEGDFVAAMEGGGGLRAGVERMRRRISARVEEVAGAGPASAVLSALTVGDRSRVSPDQAERFAASGLSHLLSVSGLHLGLTVLGCYRLLLALLRRTALGMRRDPVMVAAIACLPLVPAYALLTGAQPPVLRAAVAAGLFLVAQLAGRAPEGWTALAAAALVLLAWDPGNLHDPSFQLSFAACAGLLALSRGLRDLVPLPRPGPESPRWRRWLETPLGALTTTAAATLATLPLTAMHFQRASLAAIPANVVAVPVGLATTAVCAAAVGVGLISRVAMAPLLWVAAPLAGLLDSLAAHFASWPGATIPIAPPTAVEAIAIWAASLCLALLPRAPRPALAGLVAAVVVIWSPWSPADDDRLIVDFLAVGQGDSTLLRLPDGSRILVDAGGDLRGERDLARRVLLPQLAARGASRLDVLALSHLHPDHVGSVPTLLDTLPVGELWTTGRALEGRLGAPIAERVEALEIPRRILSRGAAPIERGGVRIEILGPPDRDDTRDEPLFGANDASLVMRIVHGDVAILLPGDVEEEGEAALLESGAALGAALIKAPHHGSATSSTPAFLERVAPRHVVFCVGRRNQFGFPRADVVSRYEKIGCRLHRTARGPVRFASDGRTIEPIAGD